MDNLTHYLDERGVKSYLSTYDSVLDAVKVMKQNNTSYVIVQDHGQDIGIFTESDLRNRVALNNYLPSNVKLHQVMTKTLKGVDVNASIDSSLKKLKKERAHHLPVVEKGKVVAVLNSRTLLKIALESVSKERSSLLEYISGAPSVNI